MSSLCLMESTSQAPCVEIIERANSIIDYDQRDEKPNERVARVCPVLRALYGASVAHSVA